MVLYGDGVAEPAQAVLGSALISLSWVVGGIAVVSLARAFGEPNSESGVEALAVQCGYTKSSLEAARGLAGAFRLFMMVARPALILLVFAMALSRQPTPITSWAALTVLVVTYCAALAAVLSLHAAWASRLSQSHAAWITVALLLIPELARGVWPNTPSVPSFFGWFLSFIAGRT
jgi:hypothetical protein